MHQTEQVNPQLRHLLHLFLLLPITLFLNPPPPPHHHLKALLLLLPLLLLLNWLDLNHHLLPLLLLLLLFPQLLLVLVRAPTLEFLLLLNPQPLALDRLLLANAASSESIRTSKSTSVARSNPVLNRWTTLCCIALHPSFISLTALSCFFVSLLFSFFLLKQQTFICPLEAKFICDLPVDI